MPRKKKEKPQDYIVLSHSKGEKVVSFGTALALLCPKFRTTANWKIAEGQNYKYADCAIYNLDDEVIFKTDKSDCGC